MVVVSQATVGQLFACVHSRHGTSKGMCVNNCCTLIFVWMHLSHSGQQSQPDSDCKTITENIYNMKCIFKGRYVGC
jgi:hypothetical protein